MVKSDDSAAKTTSQIMFPVVFFDGLLEMNTGDINIHQDLAFNEFQTMLSQMIGIHYDDLTTYLVDNRKSKTSTEPLKILITDKVKFALMVRLKNCNFFVVLNRPRTECRLIPGNQSDLLCKYWNLYDTNQKNALMSAYNSYYDDGFLDLLMERQNYINMVLNSRHRFNPCLNVILPTIEHVYPRVESSSNHAVCEDCTAAQQQGKRAEFHLCVYDEVIRGSSRSPVGSISRLR